MGRTYPHHVKYGGKYYAPGEPVEEDTPAGSQKEEDSGDKEKTPTKRSRKAAGT